MWREPEVEKQADAGASRPEEAGLSVVEAARGFGFGGVESRTLTEQITKQIVHSVVRGDLASGAQLPSEHELARQFDVSRAVIREAVQAVAMLGLIQRRQGRGTRVAPRHEWRHLAPELLLARAEIGGVEGVVLELLELRRMVEVEAAGLAASRITEEASCRCDRTWRRWTGCRMTPAPSPGTTSSSTA
jgi:DNA-binding FadR family transcriptional regulator